MSSTSFDYTTVKRFTAADGSLVALADCDTFYSSCERVARPDLVGKPIVVLSNNDGCLVSLSREAKALGIPFGKPYYSVKSELLRHGVTVFSSNYTLYGDMSRRVMQTLAKVVPEVEIYSIDEAFLHLRGNQARQALEVCAEARRRVLTGIGVPMSLGIGPTKVLAKLATSLAKKRADGLYDLSLLAPADLEALLEETEVDHLWGIGRNGAKKLRGAGLRTARQLRDADPALARSLLTVQGLNIQMELQGIPAIREEIAETHQAIISSRSLGIKVTDLGRMQQAVSMHATRAAQKLRAKGLKAQGLAVRAQTAYYRPSYEAKPFQEDYSQVHLPRPTDDTALLIRTAQSLMAQAFQPGTEYAKAMVILYDFSPARGGQANLLDQLPGVPENDRKRQRVMHLLDEINRRQGRDTLRFAAEGLSKGDHKTDWHMKQDKLSLRWTTDFNQLLTAGDAEDDPFLRNS